MNVICIICKKHELAKFSKKSLVKIVKSKFAGNLSLQSYLTSLVESRADESPLQFAPSKYQREDRLQQLAPSAIQKSKINTSKFIHNPASCLY